MKVLKSRPIVMWLLSFWVVLVVFAVRLLIADEVAQRKSEFLDAAHTIISDVSLKLNSNEVVLAGFSAFLQAVNQSDTSLATKFAATVTRSYPHIYMVEVARKVPLGEREKLESTFRKTWRPDFSVKSFSEVKHGDANILMGHAEVWPIVFMYPVSPEVEAIYGVDLQTVDYLSSALKSADANSKPVVSTVFNLYEGDRAYILLQKVSYPANSENASDRPSFFGSSMVALLLIKTDALFPDQQKAEDATDLNYRATMMSSDGKINSQLFERKTRIGWLLNRVFLPNFQLTEYIENESQPMLMAFSRQLLWTDLLGLGNLTILTLFAVTLVFVPWLTVLHLRALGAAEREQDRALHLATHDMLTGLPNRLVLVDRFHQISENWKRNGAPFALALIDLDEFKNVNDQHGHDVGDEVLKAVSSRLTGVLRSIDTITRYGGDEFIALLVNVSNSEEGKLIGQKMLAAAAQPIATAIGPMHTSCSIGIAICPVHGESLDALPSMADQAMYLSKQQGGNRVCIFSAT